MQPSNSKPIEAVIFDLDGTLIDSLGDIADAMNRTLEQMGHPSHPLDSYRFFIGDGVRKLAERALPPPARTDDEVARCLDLYSRDYSAHWNRRTRPYPGMASLLDILQKAGMPMAVLSNKPDALTRMCVETLLAPWTFTRVMGQQDAMPRKPDPAAALAIASSQGWSPAGTAFIGDTATDMKTACAAGMQAIGVTWGFRSADELRDHGAERLFDHPRDLARWLLASAGFSR